MKLGFPKRHPWNSLYSPNAVALTNLRNLKGQLRLQLFHKYPCFYFTITTLKILDIYLIKARINDTCSLIIMLIRFIISIKTGCN